MITFLPVGNKPQYKFIKQEYNKDGTLKHIISEDARYHVLWYNTQGIHCSEPNCEINKKT